MCGPVGLLYADEPWKGMGPGMDPGAMLVGGPPPGACGKGDGPPGPGVEAFEGAGDPGNGPDVGPDVGGPEKLLGGVVNKCWGPEGPTGKDGLDDDACVGPGECLLLWQGPALAAPNEERSACGVLGDTE